MKSFVSTVMTGMLGVGLLGQQAAAESMYNPVKSSIMNLNPKNFEKQVTLNREKGISVVQFYKPSEEHSKQDKGQYEKFGLEQKKMLRIGAVDCDDFSSICSKEGITEFPTYRVYPPFPVPHQDHSTGDKELDTDVLKKMSFKHIGDRVVSITAQNHDVFKDDNPGQPKVLLFTDKQKTPIVFRALSTYFDVSPLLLLKSFFPQLLFKSIWHCERMNYALFGNVLFCCLLHLSLRRETKITALTYTNACL